MFILYTYYILVKTYNYCLKNNFSKTVNNFLYRFGLTELVLYSFPPRIPQTDAIGVGTITSILCEYSLVLDVEIYFYIFKVYFLLLNNLIKNVFVFGLFRVNIKFT